MLYSLAKELGIWDVHGLEDRMSMRQFREWCKYLNIEADRREKAREAAEAQSRAKRSRGRV